MALHYELDAFKTAMALLGLVARVVRQFPRDCKPTFSNRLCDHAEAIHEYIRLANATSGNRVPIRDKAISHLERLKAWVRVLHGMGVISDSHWQKSNNITTSLGKQLYGWIK